MNKVVVKVGGSHVDDPASLARLAEAIQSIKSSGSAVVIVHGGGKEIARFQRHLGLSPRFVDGLRVTDGESLEVAEMVLSGLVNKRLVAHLVSSGVAAMGLSGVDMGLLRAEKLKGTDLGYVGRVVKVRTEVLMDLLPGTVPVISPISLGMDGYTYNVNADHAALAIAEALQAASLVFVTDTPGVLVDDRPVERLTSSKAKRLIAEDVISGGMIPKVRSALEAVMGGVGEARITDLEGLKRGGGTSVIATNVLQNRREKL